MAHGTPDWGVTAGAVTTYQLTDLAELAARLGSIVTHDRRGEVTFIETFEEGLGKWDTSLGGTGAAAYLTTRYARSGLYGVLLKAGSTTPFTSEIKHYHSYPTLSNTGVECSFNPLFDNSRFGIEVLMYDGANLARYQIMWDDNTDSLSYRDSSGAWVVFATNVPLSVVSYLLHTLKMVFDSAKQEYLRVILNDVEYSLSGINAQVVASSTAARLNVYLKVTGYTPINGELVLDDVIMTQNEPA